VSCSIRTHDGNRGLLLNHGDGANDHPTYPTKAIRLIVPFAMGGPSDITVRMLVPKLAEAFGVPVVVDNRPGAAGTIGTQIAVTAKPDGYTIAMVSSATHCGTAALYKLSYDPVNDVTPIALIGETGLLVTVHPSLPVTSIAELIAYDKANPGKLTYASSGVGSSIHLATELFNQMAGTEMTQTPYTNAATALDEVLGGRVKVLISGMLQLIPHVRSNRLRAIAVTTLKRSCAVPALPTVAETVRGYEAVSCAVVLGPKALPKNIVLRWNSEIERILHLPGMEQRLAADGLAAAGGCPEHVIEVLERDVAKWRRVVQTRNIKVQS
jgi:tripartite-type tricarboxylate transporter receptor subunit TctC